ncbi:hypothetical protein [Spongiibacter sp.]|uniref:hypothetical protein n=1 Tax=Spongiibacter sp. TaxID=2024860 RepID=UPI000C663500|nr:hypothetical protein [Spongiibacter sp.]MBU71297.1 hypothetical protein [Spongiibacter sp.]|tara:strand:- start:512 stop:955 length:444 start_codon:yes stop_codon:yes gene_type:complete
MSECLVSISISKTAIASLQDKNDAVVKKLFDNFIKPLQLGYSTNELEGKYKPSWEIPFKSANTMRTAMVEFAKANLLYHYHFGFPFYTSGKDAKYPGNESEGIVHTKFTTSGGEGELSESHIIYRVDDTHPHPFTIPMNLSDDAVPL